MPIEQLAPRRVGMGDAGSTCGGYSGAPQDVQLVCQAAYNELVPQGFSPAAIDQIVQGYTGLDAAATNAVIGIVKGGPINLNAVLPIVAGGIALIPGVGPAAAGIVMGAVEALNFIQGFFAPPAQTCAWTVGSVCFNKTRPSGPTVKAQDGSSSPNPAWVTFDAWASGVGGVFINRAFPEYTAGAGIEAQLTQANIDATAAGVTGGAEVAYQKALFLQTYFNAWKHNAEYAINGFQASDPYDIADRMTANLKKGGGVAGSWNATHSNSTVWTIDGTGSTYLDGLVKGSVNTYQNTGGLFGGQGTSPAATFAPSGAANPLYINVGAPIAGGGVASPAPPRAASSTGSKLAIGTAVAGGVALGGTALYAWLTKQAFKAVLSKGVDKAKATTHDVVDAALKKVHR